MAAQVLFRLDEETRKRFDRIARREGKSRSEKIRELIAGYVEEKDVGRAIEEVWEEAGSYLRARHSVRDVAKAVREVRRRAKGRP